MIIPACLLNKTCYVSYEGETQVYIFVFDSSKLIAMSGLDYDDTLLTLNRLLEYVR
jgi:hypothetical protein